MNPTKELMQLVSPAKIDAGVVVATQGDSMKVRTKEGILTVQKGTNTDITVGDNVRVANNLLVGGLRREDLVPVYFL